MTRGGGHARHQLASYLTSFVTPLLRSNDPSTPAGRGLYEAGAEQLYLIGWMAFDDGEHVLAQSYLIQALRLAQEAQSAALGAHVLAGLSDQATITGHPDHAVQLARAGRAGLQRAAAQPAWPTCGRYRPAPRQSWATTGRWLAPSTNRSALPIASILRTNQSGHVSSLAPTSTVNTPTPSATLERPDEATRFAALSADEAQQQGRARRGSLAHATLARAAFADHDFNVAAAQATKTVQLAATVQSSRSIEAVADLRTRLVLHDNSSAVAEFIEVADALLPMSA